MAATPHVRVAEHTGAEVGPLPEGCTVNEVERAGAEGTAWVIFFRDDAVLSDVQEEPDGGRCCALAHSLASIHFLVVGERAEGEERFVSRSKVTA